MGECCSLWFLKCKGVERRNGGEDWCAGMKTAVEDGGGWGRGKSVCFCLHLGKKSELRVTKRGREEGRKRNRRTRERSE